MLRLARSEMNAFFDPWLRIGCTRVGFLSLHRIKISYMHRLNSFADDARGMLAPSFIYGRQCRVTIHAFARILARLIDTAQVVRLLVMPVLSQTYPELRAHF